MTSRASGSTRRITLKELAAYLEVSTATVSNAFNRPDQLSSALRTRILEAAAQLGYSGPNSLARGLRTGKSGIVGVSLSDNLGYSLNDPVANQFLSGVAEVLDAHDRKLLLLPGRSEHRKQALTAVADGYILYGAQTGLVPSEMSLGDQNPIVTVDFSFSGLPSVQIDNYQASKRIAQWALSRGSLKSVAILALRLTKQSLNGRVRHHQLDNGDNAIARIRYEGFRAALREAGIAMKDVSVWNVDINSYEAATPVVEQLFDDHVPTLLLCMSDRLALTALTVAEQRALNVPEQLRITGFDGIEEGQRRAPQLTTVFQDSRLKGYIAAQRVLGMLSDDQLILPSWMIFADSCP